jgi:FixJ family two-component response regulator
MDQSASVFLVDDDEAVLSAVSRLLRSRGYDVRPYDSPRAFLAEHDPTVPGCAILDVSMPGLDGLELQHALGANGSVRPIIFITAKGDIPTTVRAMKAGAVDFLTKPVSEEDLLAAVAQANDRDREIRETQSEFATIQSKIASLTPREREVLLHVLNGRLNKQISADLGAAERTIKIHRSRVMKKLEVRSVAALVHMVEKVGIRSQLEPEVSRTKGQLDKTLDKSHD